MIYPKQNRALSFLMVLVALCVFPFAQALAGKINLSSLLGSKDPMVTLMLGKADVIDLEGPVSDVMVANPSIVDVMAIRSNRLYLVGASLGDTNIIALDDQGNIVKKMNVHVQLDVEKLESLVNELYPSEDVKIRPLSDQVILTGQVSTPSVANNIANLVAQYVAEVTEVEAESIDEVVTNMLDVHGEQQVMLKVKIVEASRSALKDLGVETSVFDTDSSQLDVSFQTSPQLGLSAPAQLGVAALNYSTGGFGPLNFLVRALEEEGIVNTLAEPNLTAISGEQAGFLAGGEFPIPTEIDRDGNLVYEFRPFGVSLNFRPMVMSESRISLQMSTEVSTTTFDQNLQLNGVNVPTFNVRRAETTVELPSGGTLMIAGLLESDTVSGVTQLPGVGDVPVIGDLIKSDTFNRDESELVVMITPYLVQPFAKKNAVSPSYDRQGSVMPTSVPEPGVMPQDMPDPTRESNALHKVFGNNIRRTYGARVPEKMIKNSGTFGYITD